MNSSQNGGKYKSSRSKKGGNFLGSVGELVAPSGWESFATTAGLFALDRADAALRRGKSVKSSAKKGGMRNFTLIELKDIGKLIKDGNNKKDYDDFLELYEKMYENSMESNRKEEVTNLVLMYYDRMNTKLHNIIFRMSKNQKLQENSEYQKLYKKIEKVKEDVVEAMRSQEELFWGNPMEEARLIQQNNSNLIYAFLRLCGYAFIKENRDEIYKKLKTLLEKEIKYREKIIRLIQNEEMMTFLANSLIDLKYIYEFVDKFVDKTKNLNQKRKIYANYIGLGLYRNEYRQKHPNIKINDLPSHNKTLSNLEEKYSNNKYRN